jgi:6-phospho-beta-glucosidase
MRVTVIGAGGFRTPLVVGVLFEAAQRLGIDEVVLYDHDPARIRLMQPVLAGLAAERGSALPLRAERDLEAAVRGAAFVLCAIRVGGARGRVVDETVPLRHGVLGQETVGPGGVAFALRTLPAMRRIALAVEAEAPDAWLINFTNPAGLITEALRQVLGDQVIGICDSPDHLCREVADGLGLPANDLGFEYGGLNHLGWLMGVRHRGRDVLPDLLADPSRAAALPAAGLFGAERLHRTGVVPNEYLFYYERPQDAIDGFRRAGRTRGELLADQQGRYYAGAGESAPDKALQRWRRAVNERNHSYMAEARDAHGEEPRADDETDPTGGYERAALAAMEALCGERRPLILNVANRGTFGFLDDDAVIEATSMVESSGARPLVTPQPPDEAQRLMTAVKEVERLTIRASMEQSRELAMEALAAHPLVPSAEVARQILDGYLAEQPGLAALLH